MSAVKPFSSERFEELKEQAFKELISQGILDPTKFQESADLMLVQAQEEHEEKASTRLEDRIAIVEELRTAATKIKKLADLDEADSEEQIFGIQFALSKLLFSALDDRDSQDEVYELKKPRKRGRSSGSAPVNENRRSQCRGVRGQTILAYVRVGKNVGTQFVDDQWSTLTFDSTVFASEPKILHELEIATAKDRKGMPPMPEDCRYVVSWIRDNASKPKIVDIVARPGEEHYEAAKAAVKSKSTD